MWIYLNVFEDLNEIREKKMSIKNIFNNTVDSIKLKALEHDSSII